MTNGKRLALAGMFAGAAIATMSMAHPHQASAADSGEDDRVTAHAIKDAYVEKDALGHRVLATRLLEDLGGRNGEQTLMLLDALVEVAAERRVDGLEPVLLSTLAQVLANPDIPVDEREGARDAVLETYAVDGDLAPHHYFPFTRPGTPIVHHVQAEYVRTTLEMMAIDPGMTSIDEAMEGDLCSEAGLADIEARRGAGARAEIEKLCETMMGGGLGGLGSLPGLPDGLSDFDCLGEHEETRSERVQRLMQDCYESMQGSDNPIADTAGSDTTTTGESAGTASATDSAGDDTTTGDTTTGDTSSTSEGGGPTLKPEATYDPNEVKYTRFKKNEDGTVQIVVEMNDGTQIKVGNDQVYPGGGTHEIFGNMEPGEEKVIVESAVRRNQNGTTTPGEDGGSLTQECLELALELEGIDLDEPPVDPTVNPVPDAPPDTEEYDCFGDDAEAIDTSYECQDEVKHCPVGELPDGECICQPAMGSMPNDIGCALVMNCMDGSLPTADCRCEGVAVEFVPRIGGGPGPSPEPEPESVPVLGITAALPALPEGSGYYHPGGGPQ